MVNQHRQAPGAILGMTEDQAVTYGDISVQ
jgi:hypothetical protein